MLFFQFARLIQEFMLALAPLDRIALYITVALAVMTAVCIVAAILDSYRAQKGDKSSAKNRHARREDSKPSSSQIKPKVLVQGQLELAGSERTPKTPPDHPTAVRQHGDNQPFREEPIYGYGDPPAHFNYRHNPIPWFGGLCYFQDSKTHGNIGEQLTHKYFLTRLTKTKYEQLPSKYDDQRGIDGIYLTRKAAGGYAGKIICVETKTQRRKNRKYEQLSVKGLRTRAKKLTKVVDPKGQRAGRLILTALQNRGRYQLERWLVYHSLILGKVQIYRVSDDGTRSVEVHRTRKLKHEIIRALNERVKKGTCFLKRRDDSASIDTAAAKSNSIVAKQDCSTRLPTSPPTPSRQLVRREKLVVECEACDGVGHTRIKKEFTCAECGGVGSRTGTLTGIELRCTDCQGKGYFRKTKKKTCSACQGSGAVSQTIEIWSRFLGYELCKACEGRGRVPTQRGRIFCAQCRHRIERCRSCGGAYICQVHSSQKCAQCEVARSEPAVVRCSACEGDGYFDCWEEYEETK